MVYTHLPNNTMWMSVAHLNDFINTSFAVDLSVVSNRQSMLRAINRMRSVAPFTRNSRFPLRSLHISLEGEWYSVFMRLTQLLSQRDRAANITSSQTDNIRTDNNMRALFAVVEEINELRTRRHGFLDREAFEEIYPWEETSEMGNRNVSPQFEQLQRQIADIATTLRMTQTPHVASPPVAQKFTDEDIQIMSAWSRPYPYSAVKERMVMIKRAVIDDIMNNPSASRTLPTDSEIRVIAINALDKQHLNANTAKPVMTAAPVPIMARSVYVQTPEHVEPCVLPSATAHTVERSESKSFADYVNEILEDGDYDTDEKEQIEDMLKQTAAAAKLIKEKSRITYSEETPVSSTQQVPVPNVLQFALPTFGATMSQSAANPASAGAQSTISGSMLFGDAYPGVKHSSAFKDPDVVTVVTAPDPANVVMAKLPPLQLIPQTAPDPMASVAATSNQMPLSDPLPSPGEVKQKPVVVRTKKKQ